MEIEDMDEAMRGALESLRQTYGKGEQMSTAQSRKAIYMAEHRRRVREMQAMESDKNAERLLEQLQIRIDRVEARIEKGEYPAIVERDRAYRGKLYRVRAEIQNDAKHNRCKRLLSEYMAENKGEVDGNDA